MWSTALVLLFVPIPGLTWRFLPSSFLWVVLGLVIQAGGMAIAFWARQELGRYWSSEVRIIADHHLVHSGPYQFVRHPIYTGMLCIFIGLAIQSGQLHSLLAIPLFVIRYSRKIPAEEKLLEQTFGDEYGLYRDHTWALIPYIY
jgi:protein-S-isoprenylcysteine O-methyltransferase Ste14